MEALLDAILSEDHLDKREMIHGVLRIMLKRIELQHFNPTVKVFQDGDYAAHTVGEINGFLQALYLTGVTKMSLVVKFVPKHRDQVEIMDEKTKCIYLELPLRDSYLLTLRNQQKRQSITDPGLTGICYTSQK